jgi:hypothetical protein
MTKADHFLEVTKGDEGFPQASRRKTCCFRWRNCYFLVMLVLGDLIGHLFASKNFRISGTAMSGRS